jgi:hypothetical protein
MEYYDWLFQVKDKWDARYARNIGRIMFIVGCSPWQAIQRVTRWRARYALMINNLLQIQEEYIGSLLDRRN